MELVILAVPFLTAAFLLWRFRKETVWWEYVVLLVPSILLFFLMRFIIVAVETESTEYLGTYAKRVVYYEDWNEYIHRTCTRTYKVGKTTRVQTYDCSYVDYHPERWEMIDKDGGSFPISKKEYSKLVKEWGGKVVFKDMHRDYYTNDGDAYYIEWNGDEKSVRGITYPKTYENKVKVSKSIFKFEDISKKEAKELGLYDYPDVADDYYQSPIIGYRGKDWKGERMFQWVNGAYGSKYQIRAFLLCFYNKDISISEKQRSYWCGGNKNELVICVGLDSLTNKVQWANVFSWQDSPMIDVKTRQWLSSQDKLSIQALGQFLKANIPNNWKRKEFKDFDYLQIELTLGQYIMILILTLGYNVGISYWLVTNQFKNEK